MMRNRQLWAMAALCAAVLVLGAALLSCGVSAGLIWWLGGGALMLIFLCYTLLRYRQIRRLSAYLESVTAGAAPLDIRENREGELSILKNDIYKTGLLLRGQAQQLQKDKNFLADALSDISHQLRTPLTGMLVMTELLEQEDLPREERARFVASIRTQLERLRWLVETLLKLSRIDAGQVDFRREKVALAGLVAEAAAPVAVAMELRGQRFEVEGDAEIFCDRRWTGEALSNLVKNCAEHAPENGTVSVYIRQNPLHTELTVEDDGQGIDPADLPRIFERFYKGKNASPESVGIGLALAKTVFNRQAAQIEAANRPQGGARFTVRFYMTEPS